mgnify:CR=1 FL=1
MEAPPPSSSGRAKSDGRIRVFTLQTRTRWLARGRPAAEQGRARSDFGAKSAASRATIEQPLRVQWRKWVCASDQLWPARGGGGGGGGGSERADEHKGARTHTLTLAPALAAHISA